MTEHLEKESSNSIRIYCLYIDSHNDIIKISLSNHDIEHNIIHKDELLKMVHCNSIQHNDCKYSFRNMMLFHLNHNNEDIEQFINDNDYHWKTYFNNSLIEINMHKDLYIHDSLPIFHDINSIFIFFHEKKSALKKNTSNKSNKSSTTKRVRIHELSNKTRKHISLA